MRKKKTKIIKVTDAATLNQLYDNSALTLEGLAEESFEEFVDVVDKLTTLTQRRLFVISGATMNKFYHLHDSNAYPKDTNIVSIMLDDMKNYEPVIFARFEWGGRWFDDVVNNNADREENGVTVIGA